MAKDTQVGKPAEKSSSGAKAAVSRANKRADEAMNRLGHALKKRAGDKKLMKQVGHHAAQAATTVTVGTSLSYAEGRYGTEKMSVAGADYRLIGGIVVTAGGLIAEAVSNGHPAAGYATAAGLGSLMSYGCGKARDAGQKARTSAGTQPGATVAPPADALLNELKATPEAKAAGANRGGRRPKRRIEPHPNAPEVPPHLAHLLRRQGRAA